MQAWDRFRQVIQDRHGYAREWKARTGGRLIGYFCSYFPEELAYAAGVLPVRILGAHEPQDLSEQHIFTMYCPYCRDCLAQGLLGRYDYLDGIGTGHSCMHIRQTFDSWQRHLSPTYSYYVFVPAHVQTPRAHPALVMELEDFQASLEVWTGHPITPQALDGAIEVYNTNRRLMRQVYELRKREPPPLSGTEAMEMVLASQMMDKTEHNRLLGAALPELSARGGGGGGFRLMVLGSENDDTELVRLFESLGAQVVIDDHCTGSRYFWNEVEPGADRLAAIASRYLERPPCPQKDLVERRRLVHVRRLVEDYRVQGAVLIQQKFCDPHEYDMAPLQDLFKEYDIPSLRLELDTTLPVGQFRTRAEAFLEMLQLEAV